MSLRNDAEAAGCPRRLPVLGVAKSGNILLTEDDNATSAICQATGRDAAGWLAQIDHFSGWDRLAWAQAELNAGRPGPMIDLADAIGPDRFPYADDLAKARGLRRELYPAV